MLYVFDIPQKYVSNVTIYSPFSSATGVGQQVWNKPRGCSMVYIFMLGGGGGGGGGEYDASGAGGAGGAGASSGQTTILMPAAFVPERLYIIVGQGGAGGTAPANTTAGTGGGAGGAGLASYVHVQPLLTGAGAPTANNILGIANPGTGGAAGANGGSSATGGTAGAVATLATMPLAGMGITQLLAGQAPPAAQATVTTAPTNTTYPTTGLLVSAGGNGGTFNGTVSIPGGQIVMPTNGLLSTITGGTTGTAVIATSSGGIGYNFFNNTGLWYSSGGAGGAGSGATGVAGGNGGDGGPGSGGGAGPNMISASPLSGRGGKGGDGLVMIISW